MDERSPAYQALEELLTDPGFWLADSFMGADDLVGQLADRDWEAIAARSTVEREWWERFLACASAVTSPAALRAALSLLAAPTVLAAECGAALLSALHRNAAEHLGAPELAQLAGAWRTFPTLRRSIAQSAWRLGISRRLRDSLGVPSWSVFSGTGA